MKWLRRAVAAERENPARARDVLVIMLTLASGGPIVVLGPAEQERNLPLAVVLSTLCAIALWWRRRYPVPVAVLGIAAYAVAALSVPLIVGLGTVAVRRRDRVLVALTIAAWAAYVANEVLVRNQTVGAAAFTGLFFVGVWVAIGAFVGARRDLLASMRERAERAEAEQSLRADQARLAERTRIAGEMHDVLAHRMSLVALHAGALEVNETADRASVQRSAELIRRTAREALEDLRDLLGVLRDADGADRRQPDTAPQPTLGDVPRLVEASRAAGVAVEVVDEVADPALVPDAVGRAGFRVVQEALTNVHKHARGASTRVRLAGAPGDALRIEVVNARPVAAGSLLPGAGFGLVGLRERVAVAGGQVEAGPTADGGWRVCATMPWLAPGTLA